MSHKRTFRLHLSLATLLQSVPNSGAIIWIGLVRVALARRECLTDLHARP